MSSSLSRRLPLSAAILLLALGGAALGLLLARVFEAPPGARPSAVQRLLDRDTVPDLEAALLEAGAGAPRARALAALAVDHGGSPAGAEEARSLLLRLPEDETSSPDALAARLLLAEDPALAREALRRHPDSVLVRTLAGRSALAEGRTVEGLEHLLGALDLDPAHGPARRALIRWAGAQGHLGLAHHHLDARLVHAPDDPEARIDRALIAHVMGLPADGPELPAAPVEDAGAAARLLLGRAGLLAAAGRAGDAGTLLGALTGAPPLLATAGLLLVAADDPEGARALLETAVSEYPGEPRLAAALAQALVALETPPVAPKAEAASLRLARGTLRPTPAQALPFEIRLTVEIPPGPDAHAVAHRVLGRRALVEGRLEEALRHLSAGGGEAALDHARALLRAGRPEAALSALGDGEGAEALHLRAAALTAVDRAPEAEALLAKAPAQLVSREILLARSRRAKSAGDAAAAVAFLVQARRLGLADAPVLALLAASHEAAGEQDEARAAYEAALQRDPANAEALAGLERLAPEVAR